MLCDLCKQRPPTVYITQRVDGKQTMKMELCEACAKAKGVSDPAGSALADLLLSLGAQQAEAKGTKNSKHPSGDPI